MARVWTAEDLKDYGFVSSEPEVHSITDAHSPHSESVDGRFRAYALRMGLRVVCILLAIVTDGWLMWVFIVGAVVLPTVAVIFANGEDRAHSRGDFSAYLTPEQRLQLEAVQASQVQADSSGSGLAEDSGQGFSVFVADGQDFIEGELVEDGAGSVSDDE